MAIMALRLVAFMAIKAIIVADGQNPHPQLRINSPRQEDPPEGGGPKLVRLPSDLEAVLNLQKQDRKRIHASILGLAPGGVR